MLKVYLDNFYSILNYIKSVSGLEWPWFMADNSKFVLFANVFHLMDNLIFDKVKIAKNFFESLTLGIFSPKIRFITLKFLLKETSRSRKYVDLIKFRLNCLKPLKNQIFS